MLCTNFGRSNLTQATKDTKFLWNYWCWNTIFCLRIAFYGKI